MYKRIILKLSGETLAPEKITGEKATVPDSVCRSLANYTEDPAVLYAWRNSLAETIERSISADLMVEMP